jgi:hypothetical protein
VEVSTRELPKMLTDILYAGLVPFVSSSPGMGKSSIIGQVANDLNLELIDVRLAQLDVSDLCGFPAIQNGKTSFIPPDVFPIAKDPIPKGKDGWLLFLDEFTSASNAVAAAAYKIVLDHKVGQHPLHPHVAIVAAGNKTTDKAIVNRMGTAMQSRLVHFNLEVGNKDWIDWALVNNIHHSIISFIEFRPTLLHNFNPNHVDNTFACPRTWSFVNSIIKDKQKLSTLDTTIIAGCIGEGPAREFKGYTDIFESLPKLTDIIKSPTTCQLTERPDVLYATSGLIAHNINKDNIESLAQYIERMPLEFQIITWINSIKRNASLQNLPRVKHWISAHAKDIL